MFKRPPRVAKNSEEDQMPNYMLLLYSDESDPEVVARRLTEYLPEWRRLIEELTAEKVLLASGRLKSAETATTVRVPDGETELTDGPFAVTREILGGYFLVDVADLDAAVKLAETLPVARYGSVEVRPERTREEMMRILEQATAAGS